MDRARVVMATARAGKNRNGDTPTLLGYAERLCPGPH